MSAAAGPATQPDLPQEVLMVVVPVDQAVVATNLSVVGAVVQVMSGKAVTDYVTGWS